MRNLVGHVAREKLGERSHAFGDALDDPKLRRSGAERGEKRGQYPVRHFAGRIVEERSKTENVYISGGGLGTLWGRCFHIRPLKIAWRKCPWARNSKSSRRFRAGGFRMIWPQRGCWRPPPCCCRWRPTAATDISATNSTTSRSRITSTGDMWTWRLWPHWCCA